ncbi:MAG: ATP-binding cassette domain-containing protein [Thermoanaerobaculales bacterium]|nr:ATP-binding cassette domain-containing protein [Thermoanaerobaculales bacterium]
MGAMRDGEYGISDAFINLEGIRHVYKGGTVALDGVDLRVGTGLFGLLGPNGAGKSTLMKILCTLLAPTEGRASVGGFDVLSSRPEVRRLIGYLPQEFGAWRLHRVAEVLDTLASLSGMRDKLRRRERVEEVLQQVGLAEVADRKVKKLSGGMLRRLGVAQALVHDPRFLIVDEPTVGLDPEERLHFRAVMAELARERTIVLSTHIVADLGSGCEDLALIDRGKVVYRGAPSDLVNQARSRVVEFSVKPTEEVALLDRIEVVSRSADAGLIHIRGVVREGAAPSGATQVDDPTLEEAYLAFMAGRGRSGFGVGEEVA